MTEVVTSQISIDIQQNKSIKGTIKRPQSNIKQQRCMILSCLHSGVFSLKAADGSLCRTIWEAAVRNCMEKDRHFEKMLGR